MLGLRLWPDVENFVLGKVGDVNSFFQPLLNRGVRVRGRRSYKLPEWIRISVGTMGQNRRFIAELEILNQAGLVKTGNPA